MRVMILAENGKDARDWARNTGIRNYTYIHRPEQLQGLEGVTLYSTVRSWRHEFAYAINEMTELRELKIMDIRDYKHEEEEES